MPYKKKKEEGGYPDPRKTFTWKNPIDDPYAQHMREVLGLNDTLSDLLPNPRMSGYERPRMEALQTQHNLGNFQLDFRPPEVDYDKMYPRPKRKDNFNPLFALRGFTTGAAWLSGIVDRGRQNQYMMDQFSTMGQRDAIPTSNFQPTNYTPYGQYGGEMHLGGSQHGILSKKEAKNILRDGEVEGHKLTRRQKHYFKHVADGQISFVDGEVKMKGKMAKGGSIVDFLNSKNKDSSFNHREELYHQLGGNDRYTGTAEQNTALLAQLSAGKQSTQESFIPITEHSSIRKSLRGEQNLPPIQDRVNDVQENNSFIPLPNNGQIPRGSAKARSLGELAGSQAQLNQIGKDSQSRQFIPGRTPARRLGELAGSQAPQAGDQSPIESGVIVDKRTGQAYVMKNGKPIKQFNVLTGNNVEGNQSNKNTTLDDVKRDASKAVTPIGYYNMDPNPNIYGKPGFDMNPINAKGMMAPDISALATHITYPGEKASRDKLYGTNHPWGTSGCINGDCRDINDLTNRFPKGDTMMVMDSKMPQFQGVARTLRGNRRFEEGGLFGEGGMTRDQAAQFLFEDDEEETMPSVDPKVEASDEIMEDSSEFERQQRDAVNDKRREMAMGIAMEDFTQRNNFFPRNRRGDSSYRGDVSAKPVNDGGVYAFNYYQMKGLSPEISAGIVGNLMRESQLNPTAIGDGGKARGIAQWHRDRYAQLERYASMKGKDATDLHTQLDYVVQEATQRGDLDRMKNARNSGEAAYIFADKFERPKNIDNERISYAKFLHPDRK